MPGSNRWSARTIARDTNRSVAGLIFVRLVVLEKINKIWKLVSAWLLQLMKGPFCQLLVPGMFPC